MLRSTAARVIVAALALVLPQVLEVVQLEDLTPVLASGPPAVVANGNREAAGSLAGGVLTLALRADEGLWRPQLDAGPALRIEAFGEESSSLSIPAPLIRVPAGTVIAAQVRNQLSRPLRVHGLCGHQGTTAQQHEATKAQTDLGAKTQRHEGTTHACQPMVVPPGEVARVRFTADVPGTFHYWATTTGMPQPFRAAQDTQLSGAFVVDGAADVPRDHVLVITEWTSLGTRDLQQIAAQDDPGAAFLAKRPDVLFVINGLAWPHTERLTYDVSERVRWRVVNLSTQVHPMHLHGFYFDVESLGTGTSDRSFAVGEQPHVVTQLLQPGATMAMAWVAERAGNWLFHCHVMTHVSPTLHVDGSTRDDAAGHHAHGPAGMTGMVLGVTVTGAAGDRRAREVPDTPARTLTLLMRRDANRFGDEPAYGFTLAENSGNNGVSVPGPTLVLMRDEPVAITLVNQLPEATAIHWHGMELDSYYDGVHGYRSGHVADPDQRRCGRARVAVAAVRGSPGDRSGRDLRLYRCRAARSAGALARGAKHRRPLADPGASAGQVTV